MNRWIGDNGAEYPLNLGLGPLAMLCFDKATNELVFQAENVQLLPTSPDVIMERERREWDLHNFHGIRWHPDPPLEATFRFHHDPKSNCIYRRTMTRAEFAKYKQRLEGAHVVD